MTIKSFHFGTAVCQSCINLLSYNKAAAQLCPFVLGAQHFKVQQELFTMPSLFAGLMSQNCRFLSIESIQIGTRIPQLEVLMGVSGGLLNTTGHLVYVHSNPLIRVFKIRLQCLTLNNITSDITLFELGALKCVGLSLSFFLFFIFFTKYTCSAAKHECLVISRLLLSDCNEQIEKR